MSSRKNRARYNLTTSRSFQKKPEIKPVASPAPQPPIEGSSGCAAATKARRSHAQRERARAPAAGAVEKEGFLGGFLGDIATDRHRFLFKMRTRL